MSEQKSGIEVKVIDWGNDQREVAIHFLDLNQMLTLNPAGARTFAFRLMECADFLEPPFADDSQKLLEDPNDNSESERFFGPYEDDEEDEADEGY